jgi:hypothetical protein
MTLGPESLLQMGRLAASAEEGLQAGLDRVLERASAARDEATSRHQEKLNLADQLDSQAGSLAKASREMASQVLNEEEICELESKAENTAPPDDMAEVWERALGVHEDLGDCFRVIEMDQNTRDTILALMFWFVLLIIVLIFILTECVL